MATKDKPAVPTLDEIRTWPATVDPEMGARPFGISRSYAYDLIKQGKFPAQVIEVGSRKRVITASILRALGGFGASETSA